MRGKALERAVMAQKVTPRDLDERVTKVSLCALYPVEVLQDCSPPTLYRLCKVFPQLPER